MIIWPAVVRSDPAMSRTARSGTVLNCGYCGIELDSTIRPGRPASYCSTSCRRLHESKLRRITRQLDALDDAIRREEGSVRGIDPCGNVSRAQERLAALRTYRS